ncbi:galactoside alpha-(1,2)-fucosyltransferase 2-like isoform X2 [Haliotis rubra]|uniref:galactoside alpha-(1,2)-fucosyltransferase 2-like isoform X2 n=1 Tax=Haliotis rubra TaxID=36100 RepID=UPI001EE61710|nr:galactoside alpha-(1,2)-fucosyltransferase 2-like isoform X2 [Haliotis rubra]
MFRLRALRHRHRSSSIFRPGVMNMRCLNTRGGRLTLISGFCVLLIIIVTHNQMVYDVIVEDMEVVRYKYQADRTNYICCDMLGGLGNLLFQYAFTLAMSLRFNMTMVCETDKIQTIQQMFDIPDCADDYKGLRLCFGEGAIKNKFNIGYDSKVGNMMLKRDTHFGGYFQSWLYWVKYEDTIREHFTIKSDLKASAENYIDASLQELGVENRSSVSLVGVHVRRGDLLNDFFREHGYFVAPEEYFHKAMAYVTKRVPKPVVFVVSSNDMEWSQEVVKETNAVFLLNNTREFDFTVLTMCDHFIMSVGTFGWWVGWHIQGLVIYYNKPFRPDSELSGVVTNDYVTTFAYPKWIGMS